MSNKKTSIDEEFPERLRELIENKLNITQGEFAKKLGITAGYVSMVLTKKRGPSAELIAGLYVYYSEYINWILTGKTQKIANKLADGRKFNVITEIEEWLAEEVQKNPRRESWFELQMIDNFESFKKWKRKRDETIDSRDNFPSSKVA